MESFMPIHGIRGATTVTADEPGLILEATHELIDSTLASNPGLKTEDIGSVIFTVTEDLVSAFPAQAAREMGWDRVPMVCAREIPVKGSLPLCVRVLIHWNTDNTQNEINHAYLRGAINLRPDLSK
jgi:chorismate mutase